jgi:hypothetical protein
MTAAAAAAIAIWDAVVDVRVIKWKNAASAAEAGTTIAIATADAARAGATPAATSVAAMNKDGKTAGADVLKTQIVSVTADAARAGPAQAAATVVGRVKKGSNAGAAAAILMPNAMTSVGAIGAVICPIVISADMVSGLGDSVVWAHRADIKITVSAEAPKGIATEVHILSAAAASVARDSAAPGTAAPWARNWGREQAGTWASPAVAVAIPADLRRAQFGCKSKTQKHGLIRI